MKERTHLITYILAVLSCIVSSSCSGDVERFSASEYELPYNLSIDVEDEVPVVIGTRKEFDRLFGEVEYNFGKIDFRKYDLVYVQGKSPNYINSLETHWQFSDSISCLTVIVDNNSVAAEFREWCVGFLLPKADAANVKVSVVYTGSRVD